MAKISKDMIIADLVKMDPNIIPILMREGMHCVGCPSAQGESLGELGQEGFCPGIGVGLEYAPDFPVGILAGCLQGGPDFRGVMSVVVQDCKALHLSPVLEPAVCSRKVFQALAGSLQGDLQCIGQSQSGQGIVDIVESGHAQRNVLADGSLADQGKRSPGPGIILDV